MEAAAAAAAAKAAVEGVAEGAAELWLVGAEALEVVDGARSGEIGASAAHAGYARVTHRTCTSMRAWRLAGCRHLCPSAFDLVDTVLSHGKELSRASACRAPRRA